MRQNVKNEYQKTIQGNTNKDLAKFHLLEPDYNRPIFEVPGIYREKIMEKLEFL